MKAKKITYLMLLFIMTTVASAQQLYFETGKTSSSFKYKDSQSAVIENLQPTSHTFLAMGYRTKFLIEGLKTSIGARYSGYGAIGNDPVLEGILEWKLNYFELDYALECKLFNINKLETYLKGTASVGFLVQGTQSVNHEIINLKNVDDFDRANMSFKLGGGFLYPATREISFYAQYLFGESVNQAGHNDNEYLKIRSKNVSFGVLINLFRNI